MKLVAMTNLDGTLFFINVDKIIALSPCLGESYTYLYIEGMDSPLPIDSKLSDLLEVLGN